MSMNNAQTNPQVVDDNQKPAPQGPEKFTMVVAFWALSNIILSVGLVTLNKLIMQTYGFQHVLTLTFFHFVATAILLEAFTRTGAFGSSVKYLPGMDNVFTAGMGVASIGFMNLSLRANSVGFYQITKLCVIPVVLFIEYVTVGKMVSLKVLSSLSVLIFGVGIATVTDVELNAAGLAWACIAVASTAQFQIWQGSKQKYHQLSAIQMAHSIAVPQSLITLVAVFLFERDVVHYKFRANYEELWLMLLTCVMACALNVTSMGLIGKTSAVTFQVVGHAKTCLIIAAGFIFFAPEVLTTQTLKNLAGVSVAVGAMIWYGQLKSAESGNVSKPVLPPADNEEELEDVALLNVSIEEEERKNAIAPKDTAGDE